MKEAKFGKMLQEERRKRGISQVELAKLTGVTVRAISYWENGGRELSISMATKLFDAMGLEMEIFVKEKQVIDNIPLEG